MKTKIIIYLDYDTDGYPISVKSSEPLDIIVITRDSEMYDENNEPDESLYEPFKVDREKLNKDEFARMERLISKNEESDDKD